MSRDVNQVTDVAKEIAGVGKRAREVADKLKQNVAATHEALDVAEDVSRALGDAAAELRGALGMQTNNPPPDSGDGEKE